MAFFNKEVEEKQKKYTVNYAYSNKDSKDLANKKKKSRRNWLIALGVIAAAVTIAAPFAIGFVATAAGATAATLTGVGVTAAAVALGVDIGFIAAFVGTRGKRKAGKEIKKQEKTVDKDDAPLNTNKVERQNTRARTTYMKTKLEKAGIYDADIKAEAETITIKNLVDSVSFNNVDKTLIDKLAGCERDASLNTETFTEDEVKKLLEGMSPSDVKAAEVFGGKIENRQASIYGNLTYEVNGNQVEQTIANGKVYTDEGQQAYEALMSYVGNVAKQNGIAINVPKAPLKVVGVKGSAQYVEFDDANFKESCEVIAMNKLARDNKVIQNKPTIREKVAEVFHR